MTEKTAVTEMTEILVFTLYPLFLPHSSSFPLHENLCTMARTPWRK